MPAGTPGAPDGPRCSLPGSFIGRDVAERRMGCNNKQIETRWSAPHPGTELLLLRLLPPVPPSALHLRGGIRHSSDEKSHTL